MANNTALYGFVNIEHLFSQRVVDISVDTIQTAVAETLIEYRRQVDGLLGTIVSPTVDYKRRYQLPSAGTLQPLDEQGNPRPVVPSGYYDVAFPIYGAGTAWGTDRVSRAMATVGDVNRFTMDAMTRDMDWMRRHILAALFTNATYSFTDPKYGSLTISTLANGDSVVYALKNGSTTTDNHFLAQANSIGNGADNPFPTIYTELDEHPSNRGPYVVYVPTNLISSITALSTFRDVRDSAIVYGADVTTSDIAYSKNITSKDQGGTYGIGDRVVGYADGCTIIEWSALPNSYMIAHATGSANDVVMRREYEEPSLQGLFAERFTPDGNHFIERFIRYAGFGVQNRIGALCYRVGNGSYAIPTGYSAPLAV